MKVSLLSTTPDALTLLLGTKNTRLGFDADPATWTDAQRAEHLAYMRDTIKSSWEFVDYVFKIEGVTRAFTHQLVRTRAGSYAQESQRTVDVRESPVLKPDNLAPDLSLLWDAAIKAAMETYSALADCGVPVQDARGILPTNMTTSIVAKFSLRTLHEMARVRLCVRTQGEYQEVFREMRARVAEVHPWAVDAGFIEVECVATGTCAFPRYGKTECKFYDPRMDLDALKTEQRAKFWAGEKQVAVPVAKGGRTM